MEFNLSFGQLRFCLVFLLSLWTLSGWSVGQVELELAFEQGWKAPSLVLSSVQLMQIGKELKNEIDDKQKLFNEQNEPQLVSSSDEALLKVEMLLRDGHLQEGIWFLDRLGFYAESEMLALKLEQRMAQGRLKIKKRTDRGITRPYWGLKDSLPVVLKPEDPWWPGSLDMEIYAYHLDRILGLNSVPLSVVDSSTKSRLSVHVGIKNTRLSGLNFRDEGYSDSYLLIYVLDYLLGNTDRHPSNSLISDLGFLIAIDNGRGSVVPGRQNSATIWNNQPPQKMTFLTNETWIHTIAQIDLDEFAKEFSLFAPPMVVLKVFQKLEELKNHLSKLVPWGPVRPISSKDRLAWHAMNSTESNKDLRLRQKGATEYEAQRILNRKMDQRKILAAFEDHLQAGIIGSALQSQIKTLTSDLTRYAPLQGTLLEFKSLSQNSKFE